jgi:hypothetical protein
MVDHRRQVRHGEFGGVILGVFGSLRPAVTAKIPAQRGCAAIEGSDDIRPDGGRVAEAAGEDDRAASPFNEGVKLQGA